MDAEVKMSEHERRCPQCGEYKRPSERTCGLWVCIEKDVRERVDDAFKRAKRQANERA